MASRPVPEKSAQFHSNGEVSVRFPLKWIASSEMVEHQSSTPQRPMRLLSDAGIGQLHDVLERQFGVAVGAGSSKLCVQHPLVNPKTHSQQAVIVTHVQLSHQPNAKKPTMRFGSFRYVVAGNNVHVQLIPTRS